MLTQDFVHDTPASRVVFGVGSRRQVADELEGLGSSRTLVIAGGAELGFADEIADALGERVVGRFTDVVMHVPVETAAAAVESAKEAGADSLLTVGGGSSVGTAKAIARESGLPIVAVPTTYAGSEMTPIWGLTENNRKTTGRDLRVLPRTVIYDPELTLSLPVELSAASGMNALAHLVEGLYSPGISPLSALSAQEGVRALATGLPGVVADPSDLAARSEVQYGAWLGGWALGTTGMGVHHKVCHTLGGTWNLPHAQTHAAVLPYATAYNEAAAPEAMARIRQAFHGAGRPAESAAAAVWQLGHDIGAPTTLRDVGFDPEAVAEAAAIVVEGRPANPRPVDVAGVQELLRAALDGDRPSQVG